MRGMNPDFVAAVCVEVEHLSREFFSAPPLPFGVRKAQPDCLTQMREIQPAEHTMPRCVVALSASDRAPDILRITTATAKRGQRQHLFVRAVRLRILDEKVSPMPASNECAVLAGDAIGAELGFNFSKSE